MSQFEKKWAAWLWGVRATDATKVAQQFIAGKRRKVGESVKRTAEVFVGARPRANLSRPFHGLLWHGPIPSNELLGYFHRVRFTDALRTRRVMKPAFSQTETLPIPCLLAFDFPGPQIGRAHV